MLSVLTVKHTHWSREHLSSVSAKSVWFGDMSQYLYIRYAGELTVDVSTDYAFANDMNTYRVRQRLDSKSVNTDAARTFIGS
jgi:HK97 family phage major capsid protein